MAARDRSEVIGVWSPQRVRVSRDGGRTFADQPLDGEIACAAFTRDGMLVTLPSSRLGWNGAWTAWVESHRFADVIDLEVEQLPEELKPADVAIVDDRGAVQALAGDPCSCHGGVQGRWLGRAAAAPMREIAWPPGDCQAAAAGLGAGGWAYWVPKAIDFDAEPRRIEAVGPDGSEHDVASANGVHGDNFFVASNGSVTLAIFGARLVRLRGAAMTVLDANAPDHVAALTVDAAGRALVLRGDRVLRFAPSGGWRALTP